MIARDFRVIGDAQEVKMRNRQVPMKDWQVRMKNRQVRIENPHVPKENRQSWIGNRRVHSARKPVAVSRFECPAFRIAIGGKTDVTFSGPPPFLGPKTCSL